MQSGLFRASARCYCWVLTNVSLVFGIFFVFLLFVGMAFSTLRFRCMRYLWTLSSMYGWEKKEKRIVVGPSGFSISRVLNKGI